MKPILFLDVDGVLNSTPWFKARSFKKRSKRPIGDRIGHFERNVDPIAVARLNRIIERTGAKVVVSSTWRLLHPFDDLCAGLRHQGFVGDIIGVTPEFDGRPRGEEIHAWLKKNLARPWPPYVILDDDSDMPRVQHRLVQTHPRWGLRDGHVTKAVALLRDKSLITPPTAAAIRYAKWKRTVGKALYAAKRGK